MADPFIGEIRMFAGTFAPQGWALCQGQLLAISENDALFSLLGTIYGGDGQTTFALPDLRGRIPIHYGSGPGLSAHPIGSKAGSEQVTLTVAQLPSHTHDPQNATNSAGTTPAPVGGVPAVAPVSAYGGPADTDLGAPVTSTAAAGNGQAHQNLMPYLCVNFIIALAGVYPSRT